MCVIEGNFDSASIGLCFFPQVTEDSISFFAQSDTGGATSPCFRVPGPRIDGYIKRIAAEPVSGFAPTSAPTLTIYDDTGNSWSVVMDTTGSADYLNGTLLPRMKGRLTFSFDTFGAATKQMRVTITCADTAEQVVGLTVTESQLSTSDVTTGNVTSTKHGFAPKSPADATKFLNGAATPAWVQPKDSDLSTSDITTNDVSSTKHGFAPKSAADATKFLNSAATPGYAQVKDSDLSTTDITTNDASTSKHGFLPKIANDGSKGLSGKDGTFRTPASYQATPSDVAATSSATQVMAGMAGSITPNLSGSILVMIAFETTPTGALITGIQLRYGTGTAPTNGAAPTGTTVGRAAATRHTAANQNYPTMIYGLITGLTLGTAYWLDVGYSTSANSITLKQCQITAVELTV